MGLGLDLANVGKGEGVRAHAGGRVQRHGGQLRLVVADHCLDRFTVETHRLQSFVERVELDPVGRGAHLQHDGFAAAQSVGFGIRSDGDRIADRSDRLGKPSGRLVDGERPRRSRDMKDAPY